MTTSTRLRTEGKMDQATGKMKELAGSVTGSKKTKTQGKLEKLKGKAKDSVGRVGAKR